MERNHRTIKRLVARSKLAVEEMMYWYNASPREAQNAESIPFNSVFSYMEVNKLPLAVDSVEVGAVNYSIGDQVVVKPSETSCMARWRPGVVTAIRNEWSVDVDGIQRHISHVRRA